MPQSYLRSRGEPRCCASPRDAAPGTSLVRRSVRTGSETPVMEPQAELRPIRQGHHVALVVVDPSASGDGQARLQAIELIATRVVERPVRDILADDTHLAVAVPNHDVAAQIGSSEEGGERGAQCGHDNSLGRSLTRPSSR